jgi:MFS family permease
MIALYFSVTNLGMVIGIAVGGFLAMSTIYLIVAIICALRILPLSRIKMRDVEKTFYQQKED